MNHVPTADDFSDDPEAQTVVGKRSRRHRQQRVEPSRVEPAPSLSETIRSKDFEKQVVQPTAKLPDFHDGSRPVKDSISVESYLLANSSRHRQPRAQRRRRAWLVLAGFGGSILIAGGVWWWIIQVLSA